jgi:CBS domain containing-hemolysin-like protein
MTLLLLYGLVAVGISFLCSLLEACLLSLPVSYVETLVEHGSRSGKVLQRMKSNIDRPLAAILTLNTIAHTAGAAGVGAQAAIVFGSAWVGLAGAIMTLLILVVSEIIPKTLGAVHAKGLAGAAALIIRAMIFICLPLIIPLEWINSLIRYPRRGRGMSRSEVLATIRLGQASGAMQGREARIAANLMGLGKIRVSDILTPRTVVFSLPETLTVAQTMDRHHPLRFARIPIYAESNENVTGYVPRFALYDARSAGEEDKTLSELARPIAILPEQASVADALEAFIQQRQHIAMVVDEYGGKAGIVTLEDVMETLLGEEIVDETDPAEDMRKLARLRKRRGRQASTRAPRSTRG